MAILNKEFLFRHKSNTLLWSYVGILGELRVYSDDLLDQLELYSKSADTFDKLNYGSC